MRRMIVLLACTLLSLCVMAGVQEGTVSTAYDVATPAKPAAALAGAGAGLCSNGAHNIKVAYVTANGISTLSPASDAVTVLDLGTNGQIAVTVVASPNPSVASVNIYMTKAGGVTYYLAASGVANSNAAVNVSVADASLTSAAPSTNTSQVDTVISAPSGEHFWQIRITNLDGAAAVYVTLDGTLVNTSTSYTIPATYNPGNPFVWSEPVGGPSGITSIHLHSTTAAVSVTYLLSAQ